MNIDEYRKFLEAYKDDKLNTNSKKRVVDIVEHFDEYSYSNSIIIAKPDIVLYGDIVIEIKIANAICLIYKKKNNVIKNVEVGEFAFVKCNNEYIELPNTYVEIIDDNNIFLLYYNGIKFNSVCCITDDNKYVRYIENKYIYINESNSTELQRKAKEVITKYIRRWNRK